MQVQARERARYEADRAEAERAERKRAARDMEWERLEQAQVRAGLQRLAKKVFSQEVRLLACSLKTMK